MAQFRLLVLGGWTAMLTALGGGLGCGAPPNAPGGTTARFVPPLVHQNNGLELRRWTGSDDLRRFWSALESVDATPALDDTKTQALFANGLALMSLEASQLPKLKIKIGEVLSEVTEWHGQAPTWRAIQSGAEPGGGAVVVNGHIRTMERGRIQLMMRSWTSWMEDGPFVHLELAIRHDDLGRKRLEEVMRGDRSLTGVVFPSLAWEMSLPADQAFVLFTLPAQAIKAKRNEPAESLWTRRDLIRSGGKPPGTRTMGPGVTPPPTIGELLLNPVRASAARAVLVFIPRIADDLFPRDHPTLVKRRTSPIGGP